VATKYVRFKTFWLDFDMTYTDEQVYSAAQTKSLGDNAQAPGIGVRRCQLVFTRSPAGSTEDVATFSMDFLNMTGGEPDDTWDAGDFGTVETALDAFDTAWKPYRAPHTSLTQYRWYRIGPAISPPNPPVRITSKSVVGTGTTSLPPQVAMTVTERTAVRRSWGRIYLPSLTTGTIGSGTGRIDSTCITTVANAMDALQGTCATADLLPVVYSRARGRAYTVESIQVDDLFDVQRPRRWDRPLIRTVKS
jgi:hypothetical protein